jgi:hypothetical protein
LPPESLSKLPTRRLMNYKELLDKTEAILKE